MSMLRRARVVRYGWAASYTNKWWHQVGDGKRTWYIREWLLLGEE